MDLLALEDDTEFETSVICALSDPDELYQGRESGEYDDLRTPGKTAMVREGIVTLGVGAVSRALAGLKPLQFAAAHKALDLIVEAVWRDNGAPPGRLDFKMKQRFVRGATPTVLPAELDADRWARYSTLFDVWMQARHAMAHRKVSVGAAGALVPYDPSGQPMTAITANELHAFSCAVRALRAALISQRASKRERLRLEWWLDQLAQVHGNPSFGAPHPTATIRLVVLGLEPVADGELSFSRARVEEHLAGQGDSGHFVDLELHAPSGETYKCSWADVPPLDPVAFHPLTRPDWLKPATRRAAGPPARA